VHLPRGVRERRQGEPDTIGVLVGLFGDHPVWRSAAAYLEEGATIDVYITTHPGEAWHLERCGDETRLLPGTAPAPDLVFRFSPGAVEALAAVEDGIGGFTAEFFHLIMDGDSERWIEIRVAAPFSVLIRRGYLSLLAAGGLRVLSAGAVHGVRNLRDLRRLVERERKRPREAWEGPPLFPSLGIESNQPGLWMRVRRITRAISRQHERIRVFFGELDTAMNERNAAGATAALQRYRAALVAHFAVEEGSLFAALDGLAPGFSDEIDELEAEHLMIERTLDDLIRAGGSADGADWKVTLDGLRRAIVRHEGREEVLARTAAREDF